MSRLGGRQIGQRLYQKRRDVNDGALRVSGLPVLTAQRPLSGPCWMGTCQPEHDSELQSAQLPSLLQRSVATAAANPDLENWSM